VVLINKVNKFGGLWNRSKTKEFTAPLTNWSSEMCTHKLRSTKEKAVHLVSSGFKGDLFCPPSVFSPPFLSVRSRKWHAENLAGQREKNAWVVMIIHQDKWSWWTECHLKANQPWKANASSSIADISYQRFRHINEADGLFYIVLTICPVSMWFHTNKCLPWGSTVVLATGLPTGFDKELRANTFF